MKLILVTLTVILWFHGMNLEAAPEKKSLPNRMEFANQERELEQVPLSAFDLHPDSVDDLKLEVWAESPMIFSPVAMDVDAKGRIWATEGIDYHRARRVRTGQSIIVLSDTDNDGRADASHVFVSEKDARPAPLGIAVFDNRIVLSATPSITVYTDVNRNAVFEPDIDKKETFLTGFQNRTHDHTLHAVVGGPSGQWYFSYGNCGADIETRDGRHFLSGCYYGHSEAIGRKSSDGHLYVGGVLMRINPDGTGLAAFAHNMRNPHDMAVSSTGDVFQADNDDPAHCRATWVMEHGNFGYADLRDGSRSWEEVAKTWEEPQGWHKDLRYSRSHWRQNYPGATPPGTIYGAGSPTGNLLIEGDELGAQFRGLYLVCDMVRKEVMGYFPKPADARIEMGPHHAFVGLKPDSKGEHFLPTDVVLGLDGSLFLSDFYNDTSRGTNQVSGTIYRLSRRNGKMTDPVVDFESRAGLLAALKSPAVNVRCEAVRRLQAEGDAVAAPLVEWFKKDSNPNYQARAIWVLAQLGEQGRVFVSDLLKSDNDQHRLVAFRALRYAQPERVLRLSRRLAVDPSSTIRREIALLLRDFPFDECGEILGAVIEGFDGENRWYLEAIGTGATGKEKKVYERLIRPGLSAVSKEHWDGRAKNLAWRMHTPEAIEDLQLVIKTQKPDLKEFRHLVMAYARFDNETERLSRREFLTELAGLQDFSGEDYQDTISEVLAKDLNNLTGELLRTSYIMPKEFGVETKVSDVDMIVELKGDAEQGRARAQLCTVCHRIEGKGVAFGPGLSEWGKARTIKEIISEIVDPSAKLAHGYDTPVRITAGKHVAEGMLSNYSHHAGSLKLKTFGGEMRKILFRKSGATVERLENHSWMPPASAMGLSDQDIRNIAEYLKKR